MHGTDKYDVSDLAGLPFFKGLDDDHLRIFLREADILTYHKGHDLFTAGDPVRKMFVVLSGWVKLYSATLKGEEAVLAILSRGDSFGETAAFDAAMHLFSAEVVEEATLLEIPASMMKRLVAKDPDMAGRIMASLARAMHRLQLDNEHLSIMTAPQRVCCLLLQLSAGMIGKGGTFIFPYDKSLAAARLGMKPETFSRALAQLKPFGVTVIGSEISITSFERLMQYVCGHCSLQAGGCRPAPQGARNGGCKSGCRSAGDVSRADPPRRDKENPH